MLRKKQKVVVQWLDAAAFPTPKRKVALSPMQVTGILESDMPDYILIKDPINIRLVDGKKHPRGKKPTFYFIPKGMVKSVKSLRY